MEDHWFVRLPHFQDSRQVRFSAIHTTHPLPPGRFVVLTSVRGSVDPRTIVRLEGLGGLKNPVTSTGIEPATFQLITYCLNQLCYPVKADPLKM
jgi:hypothetical protein